MAKARDIDLEGLTFREAASRIVEVRAREVFEHSEGVLDMEDIERVGVNIRDWVRQVGA